MIHERDAKEVDEHKAMSPSVEGAATIGACVYYKGSLKLCMTSTQAACEAAHGTFYPNDNCQNHTDD